MFWIFVFFFILAKVSVTDANGTSEGLDPSIIALHIKCQNKLGVLNHIPVMLIFNNLLKCFPDPNPYVVCTDPKHEECIKRFMLNLNQCLDPDEKYLPKLLLGVYGRLCSRGRDQRGVNYIKSIPCYNNIKEIMQEAVSLKCVSQIHFLKNLDKRIISLNDEHVCSDIHIVAECLLGALKKGCRLSEQHKTTLTSVFESLQTKCNSHSTV